MSRTIILSGLIVISILLVGCNSTPKVSPTPVGAEETQAAIDTQAAADAAATNQALSTDNAQATIDAGATATVADRQTQVAEVAESTNAAKTAVMEQSLTATAEYIQQATAQAQPMMDALQMLSDEGIITNMEGNYYPLMDFDQSLAMINYTYAGDSTGFDVNNFVFKANFAWNTASDKTNWDRSGCGLIFGFSDSRKYDYVFLGLDGYANLYRPEKNGPQLFPIAKMRYSGKLSIPEGDAEVMLVVVGKRIYFYVNNEKVLDAYDGLFVPGPLVYTLVSGTNKGYGTRCTITEAGLWEFAP
jgi:hypothetical protein